MTFPGDKEGKAKEKSGAKSSHITPESRGRKRTPSGDVGNALRSVYDRTLNEDIPPEMLDLLGKLG